MKRILLTCLLGMLSMSGFAATAKLGTLWTNSTVVTAEADQIALGTLSNETARATNAEAVATAAAATAQATATAAAVTGGLNTAAAAAAQATANAGCTTGGVALAIANAANTTGGLNTAAIASEALQRIAGDLAGSNYAVTVANSASNGAVSVAAAALTVETNRAQAAEATLYPRSNPSNYVASSTLALGLAAGSNNVAATASGITNWANGQFYPSNNPNGFQTAAQVTNIATALASGVSTNDPAYLAALTNLVAVGGTVAITGRVAYISIPAGTSTGTVQAIIAAWAGTGTVYAATTAPWSGLTGTQPKLAAATNADTVTTLTGAQIAAAGGLTNAAQFATAAQGSLAATALQPGGNGSGLTGITAAQVGAVGTVITGPQTNSPIAGVLTLPAVPMSRQVFVDANGLGQFTTVASALSWVAVQHVSNPTTWYSVVLNSGTYNESVTVTDYTVLTCIGPKSRARITGLTTITGTVGCYLSGLQFSTDGSYPASVIVTNSSATIVMSECDFPNSFTVAGPAYSVMLTNNLAGCDFKIYGGELYTQNNSASTNAKCIAFGGFSNAAPCYIEVFNSRVKLSGNSNPNSGYLCWLTGSEWLELNGVAFDVLHDSAPKFHCDGTSIVAWYSSYMNEEYPGNPFVTEGTSAIPIHYGNIQTTRITETPTVISLQTNVVIAGSLVVSNGVSGITSAMVGAVSTNDTRYLAALTNAAAFATAGSATALSTTQMQVRIALDGFTNTIGSISTTQATITAALGGFSNSVGSASNSIVTGSYTPTNLPTISTTVTVSQASGKFVNIVQTNNVTIVMGNDWASGNQIIRCLNVFPAGYSTTWGTGFSTITAGVGTWSATRTNQVLILGLATATNATFALTTITLTP